MECGAKTHPGIRNHRLKYIYDLDAILWTLTGILINMPILQLNIFGGFGLYNIVLIIILFKRIRNKSVKINKAKITFLLYYLCMFISLVIASYTVPREWFLSSLRGTIKLAVLMMGLLIILDDTYILKYRSFFFRGVVIAAYVDFVWIVAQALLWNSARVSLNERIFGISMLVQNKGDLVLTGLSWERANAAILFSMAYVLREKTYFRLMCVISVLMTSSRTGLLLLLIAFVSDFSGKLSKKKIKDVLKKAVVALLAIALFLVVGRMAGMGIVVKLFERISYLITRIQYIYLRTNDWGVNELDYHIQYILWIPEALSSIPVLQAMFGCGTRISGWVYTTVFGRFASGGPWNIECDLAAILFGNGIIGLILYYLSLFKALKFNKRNKLHTILELFLIGGIVYVFYTSTLSLVVITLCLVRNKTEEMTVRSSNKPERQMHL